MSLNSLYLSLIQRDIFCGEKSGHFLPVLVEKERNESGATGCCANQSSWVTIQNRSQLRCRFMRSLNVLGSGSANVKNEALPW